MLYCLLGFILFYGFFYGIGFYPLLDVDETRYVDIARVMFNSKDYLTLYLNGDYFFEKPPLYFWLECISFSLFGVVNEFSARISIILLSLFPAGLLLFLCRKVKGDKFAIITLSTLFTSIEYMFMTKIAILDSVLTSFVSSSVICYFCTFFVQKQNQKYFWVLSYIFSGFAVLAKGIPGIVIPILVIIVSTIIFKTYKATLKYSWGVLLFLIIVLPWHIIMLKTYPDLFFTEYIYKHHILRFLGAEVINRTEPLYFYFLVLLWGLFPHVFVLFSQNKKIKNIKFDFSNNYTKLLTLNLIAILVIFMFFSSSKTKLITYILPIYPFCAVLIGSIWFKYINHGDKNVHQALMLINTIFTIAIFAMAGIKFFMPVAIYESFQPLQIISFMILIPFIIVNWNFIIKRRRLQSFLTLTIMFSLLSGFVTPCAYKFDFSFGQDDLIKFAKYAKNNNYTISTYLTGKKYSLLYYGNQSTVCFQTEKDLNWLKKELEKENHIVIVRNNNIENLPVKIKEKGTKYSIIEGIDNEKQ